MSKEFVPLNVISVSFHDDALDALQTPDGKIWVVLRRCCDALGIDADSQRKRLADQERCPWATTVMMTVVAQDGKQREVVLIDHKTFGMWLATIDASRVDEAAREKIRRYQCECADVLHAHFFPKKEPVPTDPIIHALTLANAATAAVIEARKAQIELEQQTANAQRLARQAILHADAALAVHQSNHGCYSVLAWVRLQGRVIDVKEASRHGRVLSGICRDAGIEVGHVRDPRFGMVNTYPEPILSSYLGPVHYTA